MPFLSLCNEILLYFCFRTHHVAIVCFIKRRVIAKGFFVLLLFPFFKNYFCFGVFAVVKRQPITQIHTYILKLRLQFILKSGEVTDRTKSSELSFYMLFSLLICLDLYNIHCNAGILSILLTRIDKTEKGETEIEFFLMMKRNSSSNSSWK